MYYIVEGKMIVDDCSISEHLIGGNKSAEDETAGTEDTVKVISDLLCSSKLEQVPSIVSKKDFKNAIKKYAKKLLSHVSETDPERATLLKASLSEVVKIVLDKFDNFQFYATKGDGFDLDGIIIPYEQDDEFGLEKVGTKCQIMVFKDALIIEKC